MITVIHHLSLGLTHLKIGNQDVWKRADGATGFDVDGANIWQLVDGSLETHPQGDDHIWDALQAEVDAD